MSKPSRPSDPSNKTGRARTFFVTSGTAGGRSLFQTDGMASLLVDVLRSYVRDGRFIIHDFTVMPNHLHILLTIPSNATIEQVMQLVKGNFSFRAKKELGFCGEVWQRGFSDVRITNPESFFQHREYIDQNLVKAGLVEAPEQFPYGSAHLKRQKHAGAKARPELPRNGTTEVVP